MRSRLSLTHALAQKRLEVHHVVMLVLPNHTPTQPRSKPNTRMVQLVRNDETPLAHERRERRRIRREPHPDNHRVLGPDKIGDEPLGLDVQVVRPNVRAAARARDAKELDHRFGLVGAGSSGLGEAKVVVRRDVERLSRFAGEGEGGVEVGRGAVENGGGARGDGGDGATEAVVDAELEAARVERVEVGVEWCVALRVSGLAGHRRKGGGTHVVRLEMRVLGGEHPLAEEVA